MKIKELQQQIEERLKQEPSEPKDKWQVRNQIRTAIEDVLKKNHIAAYVDYPRNNTEQEFIIYAQNCSGSTSWGIYVFYKLSRTLNNSRWGYGSKVASYTVKSIEIPDPRRFEKSSAGDTNIEDLLAEQIDMRNEKLDTAKKEFEDYKAFVEKNPDFFKYVKLDKKYRYQLPEEIRDLAWKY